MEYKNLKIEWLGHSGLKIKDNKLGMVIYIDPFKLREDYFEAEKADFIFITHSHYDHCSIEDINKIAKDSTMIICTPDVSSKLRMIDKKVHVMIAEPGNKYEFIDIFVVLHIKVPEPPEKTPGGAHGPYLYAASRTARQAFHRFPRN